MNDITSELVKLYTLTGADFVRQLKLIVAEGGFHPAEGETNIFSLGGEQGDDYDRNIYQEKCCIKQRIPQDDDEQLPKMKNRTK